MAQVEDVGEAVLGVVEECCCSGLSKEEKLACKCFVVLPLVVLALMLGLYVNPKNPEFSVEDFYVSAFDKMSGNITSNTISFNIKLRNQNAAIGLYYDGPVNLTFTFIPRETNNKIIWKYSVPKFYQGNAQSRRLVDEITPLEATSMPVFNQTAVAEHASFIPARVSSTGLEPLLYFRVDFVTKVRFRLIGKHHAKDFSLSADVPIGANTGVKFANIGIQASAASGIGWGSAQTALMVGLTVINLIVM